MKSKNMIEPSEEIDGSLKQYATRYIPLKKARDKAWSAAVDEKHGVGLMLLPSCRLGY